MNQLVVQYAITVRNGSDFSGQFKRELEVRADPETIMETLDEMGPIVVKLFTAKAGRNLLKAYLESKADDQDDQNSDA